MLFMLFEKFTKTKYINVILLYIKNKVLNIFKNKFLNFLEKFQTT